MKRVMYAQARFEFMRMPATGAIALAEPRGPFEVEVRMDRDCKFWQALLLPTHQKMHLGDKKHTTMDSACKAAEGAFRVCTQGWQYFDEFKQPMEVKSAS